MKNYQVQDILAIEWLSEHPVGVVVIAHGMVEHASRYEEMASKLTEAGYHVYAIHHLGHGDMISEKSKKGHWPKDGFNTSVLRIGILVDALKAKHPGLPVFLFGHSMGSFMSQAYITEFHNIDGLILSGTNGPSAMAKGGYILSHLLFAFSDNTKPNKFLDKLFFDPFSKPFKPSRTRFDWLSSDPKVVDSYVNDPYCGFVCTTGFYKEFLKGIAHLHEKEKLANIDRSLPIYLYAGDTDPVGNQGKGPLSLEAIYKKLGLHDVTLRLYPKGRHEMHNEFQKEEVFSDVIAWLNLHLPKKPEVVAAPKPKAKPKTTKKVAG